MARRTTKGLLERVPFFASRRPPAAMMPLVADAMYAGVTEFAMVDPDHLKEASASNLDLAKVEP